MRVERRVDVFRTEVRRVGDTGGWRVVCGGSGGGGRGGGRREGDVLDIALERGVCRGSRS